MLLESRIVSITSNVLQTRLPMVCLVRMVLLIAMLMGLQCAQGQIFHHGRMVEAMVMLVTFALRTLSRMSVVVPRDPTMSHRLELRFRFH